MRAAWILGSLLPFSLVFGVTENWNVDADGNWGTATNWLPVGIPNTQGQVVVLGNVTSAPRTITLDISPTIGMVTFNETNGYTISPSAANFLAFSVASGTANITVTNAANTTPHLIAAPLTLMSNLVINQNCPNPFTISGIMSGGASVTSTGSGVLIFSGANTFSGGLVISAGTLECDSGTTLPAASTVNMNGGILDLNNNPQTIGGLTGSSNILTGGAALTVATTGATSYGGQISGTGSLVVSGTGTLTLTAGNSYNGGTTVNGRTLQLGVNNALNTAGSLAVNSPGVFDMNSFSQTVSSISGSGSVTLGSGILTIQGVNPSPFSGIISGSGSVVQNGSGTATFSGANAYTGGTTINGGTLQLGASNALPQGGNVAMTGGVFDLNNFSQTIGTLSGTGSVTLGSGQLTVAPLSSVSFSGVISGGGSVVFQGPATWTLLASQTYTGGTTITGGILRMGVANGLASTGVVVVNTPGVLDLNNNPLTIRSLAGSGGVTLGSGNLTLNTSTTTTFSGGISGTGMLTVQGSGTQILTGTNSYSGGTIVGGTATLQGTTSSLQGAIVNNSTLAFVQSFSGQFAGPLSGGGTLQIGGGGGTVTLTGTPSQGAVNVNGAQLKIAAGANLTAPTVTIGAVGTLGGGGTITGSVFNGGTINPDGTLTVTGNVTFQPGSFFVADLTPTTSDLLTVNGNVTIQNNSKVIVDAIRGEYEAVTRYTIITSAANPVAGQFQSFELTNPFLEVAFVYNQNPSFAGAVELDLSIKPFAEVIQGGNAGAIAKCVTLANLRRDHDFEQLIADIIFLTVDQVRSILEEMQPSQLRSLTLAEQNNALFAQQTISWRMAEFDRTECERQISSCSPWNFWISLAGDWTDQRPAEHNIGYHAPAVAFTTGFDGKVAENLYLGAAFEYGHTALSWESNRGSSVINRGSIGPYLSWIGRFGYINGTILGSYASFDTDREIPFFGREASSIHAGEGLLTHLDGGVVFRPAPGVSITPFASGDLLFGWENEFKETGAESLDFTIASSTSTLLRTELGLKVSKCAVHSHGKWIHDLKASWVREERFNGQDLHATFRQFPCGFTVQGLYPSRSLLDVGMGLTFLFKKDRFAVTLRYEGQFGEGVSLQSGITQLLTRF